MKSKTEQINPSYDGPEAPEVSLKFLKLYIAKLSSNWLI